MISCANKILSRSNNILSRRNMLKNKTRMSLPGFRSFIHFNSELQIANTCVTYIVSSFLSSIIVDEMIKPFLPHHRFVALMNKIIMHFIG